MPRWSPSVQAPAARPLDFSPIGSALADVLQERERAKQGRLAQSRYDDGQRVAAEERARTLAMTPGLQRQSAPGAMATVPYDEPEATPDRDNGAGGPTDIAAALGANAMRPARAAPAAAPAPAAALPRFTMDGSSYAYDPMGAARQKAQETEILNGPARDRRLKAYVDAGYSPDEAALALEDPQLADNIWTTRHPRPAPVQPPHYDPERGVFVDPAGTFTPIPGLPAKPAPPRAWAPASADEYVKVHAAVAQASAAARADNPSGRNSGADVRAAQTDLRSTESRYSSMLRHRPKPAQYINPQTYQPDANAFRGAMTDWRADSTEKATDRTRAQSSLDALRAGIPAPGGAPGRAAAPVAAPAVDTAALERDMAQAAASYQALLRNPKIPKAEAQAAYNEDVAAIARKHGALR